MNTTVKEVVTQLVGLYITASLISSTFTLLTKVVRGVKKFSA